MELPRHEAPESVTNPKIVKEDIDVEAVVDELWDMTLFKCIPIKENSGSWKR